MIESHTILVFVLSQTGDVLCCRALRVSRTQDSRAAASSYRTVSKSAARKQKSVHNILSPIQQYLKKKSYKLTQRFFVNVWHVYLHNDTLLVFWNETL